MIYTGEDVEAFLDMTRCSREANGYRAKATKYQLEENRIYREAWAKTCPRPRRAYVNADALLISQNLDKSFLHPQDKLFADFEIYDKKITNIHAEGGRIWMRKCDMAAIERIKVER